MRTIAEWFSDDNEEIIQFKTMRKMQEDAKNRGWKFTENEDGTEIIVDWGSGETTRYILKTRLA